MGTGILAVCLCLALGQNAGDVRYANFRNLRVPVDVPVALQPEIRELMLYASANQGREWKQVAGPISPDKKASTPAAGGSCAFASPGVGAA